jgi:hypothetical protein
MLAGMRPALQGLEPRRIPWWQRPAVRRVTLVAILAACYMQYHYLQVLAEIAALPSVVVFVPVNS